METWSNTAWSIVIDDDYMKGAIASPDDESAVH